MRSLKIKKRRVKGIKGQRGKGIRQKPEGIRVKEKIMNTQFSMLNSEI